MRVALYCRCGAAWRGTHLSIIDCNRLNALFKQLHCDPECGPATAKQAARNRRKAEAEMMKLEQ